MGKSFSFKEQQRYLPRQSVSNHPQFRALSRTSPRIPCMRYETLETDRKRPLTAENSEFLLMSMCNP